MREYGGAPASDDGIPGDLYIEIEIQRHPWFERDSADLLMGLPVGFSDLALGTKIEIPHIDGENLVVKIMCQRASSCGHQPKREGANKNKSKSSPVASLELRPLLKENTKSISTQRLPAFVRNASPVIEALIDKKSDTLVPKCFQDTPFGPSTWIQIAKSMR